jgi:hypothetical protein
MVETFPSQHGDYKDKSRKRLRHFVLFALLLCTNGLLGLWLSAGAAHSQPLQQISPMETATPDPFAFPTETPDPFAFPTNTPDPFAFPTNTPDPFAFPTETPDPFAFPTETPDPFAFPTETPDPLATSTPDPFAIEEEPPSEEEGSLLGLPPADRPIEVAPTSSPDAFGVIGSVISSMASVAAWLWFLCGSLIFFVVAGIVGGLLFSQRERHRYYLYRVEPEESPLLEVIEPSKPERRDDDIWPASLP